MERCRALFGGNVQGVGFRFRTTHLAEPFAVTGFVRNLPDGQVELVAEGERAEIEAFLDAVRDAMEHNIRDCSLDWLDAHGEFATFQIRY